MSIFSQGNLAEVKLYKDTANREQGRIAKKYTKKREKAKMNKELGRNVQEKA